MSEEELAELLALLLSYRYPPHGRRAAAIETDVTWDRLRAPPVDTPPHDLHISDCLADIRPGDHIEIQWRRNKEFPYGDFSFPFSSLAYFIESFQLSYRQLFPLSTSLHTSSSYAELPRRKEVSTKHRKFRQ